MADGSPTSSSPHITPAMRQFHRFKQQHPGCVLFFRMGDFYEMFYEDAELAHKVLGVTLTQRTKGIPMAGVPYHAVEGYLRRMVQAGYRVAICDQVQDPAEAKASGGGVVERDVTRVITPGTLTDESLLRDDEENPLAAVLFHGAEDEPDQPVSIAWCELSTGSFHLATLSIHEAPDELARIAPREVLFVETATNDVPGRVKAVTHGLGAVLCGRPGWQFRQREAVEVLRKQYQVATLGGFGFSDEDKALGAAGAVVHYLLETQRTTDSGRLAHLRPPMRFSRANHMVIDQTSLRSLEVDATLRSGGSEGSLLHVLGGGISGGRCVTAMGRRLLRHWLCYPLCDRAAIETRQRIVQAMVDDSRFLDELRAALSEVQDVQRISARLSVGRATPRDLVALGRSAACIDALRQALTDRPTTAAYHQRAAGIREALAKLAQRIEQACTHEPPGHLRNGGLIKDGYDAELDESRSLQRDSHTWLAKYQKSLIEQTDIPSLKVGYNKVFGYYIEVTAVHRGKVTETDPAPQNPFRGWMRKQTLKNAERFITPELKEFEGKVLSAESRAVAREQALFDDLCQAARKQIDALHAFAELAGELDVLGCFAGRAVRHRYVKPTIVDEPVLRIDAGRHPVLDELLGDRFVPNDVALGSGGQESGDGSQESGQSTLNGATLALITGPNMAGKSTYIRQAALITLLAHTGSFVPAERAVVGLTDRIFTRIGASDELHAGQSTFMVEMTETANLCHHATSRSLIILDEIGRGTSTLDGLSLAWAIAEHIAGKRSRCLFATHYHELTTLGDPGVVPGVVPGDDRGKGFDNVCNLNVTVREWQDEVVFLHRIVPGATDRSYGIHVAKIAGIPESIVKRANALLAELTVSHETSRVSVKPDTNMRSTSQLSLFHSAEPHPIVEELRSKDLNTLTPIQAFDLIRHWKAQLEEGGC